MGGGTQTYQKVTPVEGNDSIIGRLRFLFFCSLLTISGAGFLLYCAMIEVQYNIKNTDHPNNHHYNICILGMAVASTVCASGLFCWVGLWRHQRKEYGPLALAQGLVIVGIFGLVTLVGLLYYWWVDRPALGQVPAQGVNKLWLSCISLGLFVMLMIYSCANLTLKWKSAAIFQWSSAAVCFIIFLLSIATVVFAALTIQEFKKFGTWPTCWSVYGAIGVSGITTLTMVYSLPIKDRPQLINILVILPILIGGFATCWFNYYGAYINNVRIDLLYGSSLLGIGTQALLLFMFVTGMTWRAYQLPVVED